VFLSLGVKHVSYSTMIATQGSIRRLEELEPAHRPHWAGSNTPIERAPSGAIAIFSDASFP